MEPVEGRSFIPLLPDKETTEWAQSASTPEAAQRRIRLITDNMKIHAQIGRFALEIEESEDGDKLRIKPPLTEDEYVILNRSAYFKRILEEVNKDG